jgi:hypothetical protein
MIKIANNLLPLLTKTSADAPPAPAPNFAQRMAGGINKGLTGLTNAYNQGTQAIQQDPTIPNMVQSANRGVQNATNFAQDHLAQRTIPNFVESVTNEVPSVINNFEGAAGAYGNNLLARGKAIGSGIAGLSGAANQGLANATSLVDPTADQVDSAIDAARPTFEQAGTQIEGAANQLGQQYEAAGQGVQGAMNLAGKGLDAGATALRDRLRARYPGLMGPDPEVQTEFERLNGFPPAKYRHQRDQWTPKQQDLFK